MSSREQEIAKIAKMYTKYLNGPLGRGVMDHLKEGIGLRGYAQQNPLLIYKKEGFELFQEMIARVKEETLGILFRIQLAEPEKIDDLRKPREKNLTFSSGDAPAKKKPVNRI